MRDNPNPNPHGNWPGPSISPGRELITARGYKGEFVYPEDERVIGIESDCWKRKGWLRLMTPTKAQESQSDVRARIGVACL